MNTNPAIFSVSATESILDEAMNHIKIEGLHVIRCSFTGAVYGTIDDSTIRETLKCHLLEMPGITAERLANEWELTYYATAFRPSPMMQRVLSAKNQALPFTSLTQDHDGKRRLFVYFLQHTLFSKVKLSLDDIRQRNLFISATYEWLLAASEPVIGKAEAMLFHLTILDSIASLPVYIVTSRSDSKIRKLRAELLESDGDELLDRLEALIKYLRKAILTFDTLIRAGSLYSAPVAIALSAKAQAYEIAVKEPRDQKSDDLLLKLQRDLAASYGGGSVITRKVSHHHVMRQIIAKSRDDARIAKGKAPKTRQSMSVSMEVKAEMALRVAAAFPNMLGLFGNLNKKQGG